MHIKVNTTKADQGLPKILSTVTPMTQLTSNTKQRYFSEDRNFNEDLQTSFTIKDFAGNKPKNALSLDQVTPELAAQIVKFYILPMFDSDPKKGLKRKNSRGKSTNFSQGNMKNPLDKPNSSSNFQAQGNTVFGELKLSETLYNELSHVRSQFDSLIDQV